MTAFLALIQRGGYVMYPIGICSLIAMWVFIERFWSFRRASVNAAEFTAGIRNLVQNKRITEAITLCTETPGPVAAVLRTALLSHGFSKEEIEEAIERAARYELPRLEHNLAVIATLARVTPLLGLLGTVTGMIQTFYVIQTNAPFIQPAQLAKGIWESLLTTAFGLVVAIPCHVAYDYLTSKVGSFAADMDRSAADIVEILTDTEINE
ncbi:MAG: MotA/TolQ/ExbB proton channel family protein [Chlamydiae bacterium]|nr:MAG: MotA/TolQ/ExbB proton channel family protein [Chlamydiota bacterium]